MRNQGAALRLLSEEIHSAIAMAGEQGVQASWCSQLEAAVATVANVTMQLGALGMSGDVDGMLLHSVDYLEMFSILVLAWQWLTMAGAARRGLSTDPHSEAFYRGKLSAAQYWFSTELPRLETLATLCLSGEDSYAKMQPDWF